MNILCWSGGKDSTASIILDHQKNGHQIDEIVICLNFFDIKRKIYADHPKHIEFVFKAKKVFESWGYKITIVSSKHDYLYWFFKQRKNSKNPNFNGKYYGWILGGMCVMTMEKTRPIKEYLKGLKDYTEYVGIGIEETQRLERLHARHQISLLEKYGMTCEDAKNLCQEYGLLSPLYETCKRQGCWFCPNRSIKQFAELKKEYPNLWGELVELSKEKNIISKGFRYGLSFDEIRNQVDLITNQINLWDIIGVENDN